MRISDNWLKEYLKIDLKPDKVAEILTSIGLEVESINLFQLVKGGLDGFIVGEVISVIKHPGADKLSVTKVNAGSGELLNIVCGAPNVAAGQKVIVAMVGSAVFRLNDEIKIKKTIIRGELSEGMICAEDETGLGTSHEGILVLDKDAIPGTPAAEYFHLIDDFIFEIGLTPNRVDAASHYGVARDLAAYFNSFSSADLTLPPVEKFKVDNNDLRIEVSIPDESSCLRYSGISISGIEVKDSPGWLKTRLLSIGLKPINNIVDITNFVLFETGQPLHAFDADMISGSKIIVRTMNETGKFITLDNSERILTYEDLLICNEELPMCLAGITGGKNSGINSSTKNVFIESACFNPAFIRRTSKRLGIITDSSFRFERGTDINGTIYALKRAAILITELAGGKVSSEIIDVCPNPVEHFEVNVSFENISRLLGISFENDKLKKILHSLEIKILSENEKGFLLGVPTYKVDVIREADVIEEIIRIYGYDNIPVNMKLNSSISFSSKPDKEKVLDDIAGFLASNGFSEIMTNSLTNSEYNRDYFNDNNSTVVLLNPISKELDSMRTTMLFGGLESILHNINRKNFNLKFFESGNTYISNPGVNSASIPEKFFETPHISLFLTGMKNETNWSNNNSQPVNFYLLKSYVENLLERVGVRCKSLIVNEISGNVFAFGLKYSSKDIVITEFGKISGTILNGFDIKQDVYFADILFNNLISRIDNYKIEFFDLPRFPEVKRDLALLVDKMIKFEELKDQAFKAETTLLKKVTIFDIYEDMKIGNDKKSYALSFILQDEKRTLTDQRVDIAMKKIAAAFAEKFNAKIR